MLSRDRIRRSSARKPSARAPTIQGRGALQLIPRSEVGTSCPRSRLHVGVQSFFSDFPYEHYTDCTQADSQCAFYGQNRPHPIDIKRPWDPDNLLDYAKAPRKRAEAGD